VLADKSERAYLNQLPTSFVLSDEAVDRLRAAAQTIIFNSPEFQQVQKEGRAPVVDRPATGATVGTAAVTVPTAAPAAR
jgi:NTE family protein